MSRPFSFMRLQGTVSVLALSTAAVIGSSVAQPAKAQEGIFGGGSSLISLAMRQLMDCYGDPLNDGTKPVASCPTTSAVIGEYAAVGSGNGFRGFIANDPHQLFLGSPNATTGAINMPAKPPAYINELGGDPLNAYPYPNIDFGASDSPLSTASPLTTSAFQTFSPTSGWVTDSTTFSPVTATGTATTTYNTAAFGAPIQLPMIEVPVAIAVNTSNMTVKSASTTPTDAGGAIQLTTPQLCAIFSGAVTDWSSTADIAFVNNTGDVGTQTFEAANVGQGAPGAGDPAAAVPYASSLPITVVYRTDGSGTSFIITNYLKSVCPQLDNGTNKYAQIFTTSLPSTSFSQLITNINTAFPTENRTTGWVGADGSQNVSIAVNNDVAQAGRIGYLSVDFSSPYLTNNDSAATYAPRSASVQNEALRASGTYLPLPTSGGANAPTFIVPNPTTANAAFAGLTTPPAGSTYGAWDLYSQVWTTSMSGGVAIGTKSRLGIPTATGAYPVAGTTFAALYSCYRSDSGPTERADRIKAFLDWYFLPGTGTPAVLTLARNGFGALPVALRSAARTKAATIAAAGNGACASMSGG